MVNLLNLLGLVDLRSKFTVYVVYVRLPITQSGICLRGKVTENTDFMCQENIGSRKFETFLLKNLCMITE